MRKYLKSIINSICYYNSMKQILTSKHKLSQLNVGKAQALNEFVKQYKIDFRHYTNFFLNNKITTTSINKKTNVEKTTVLDIPNDILNTPLFVSTTKVPYKSSLSVRARTCAITQALGAVKALIDKRKRLLFVKSKLIKKNESTVRIDNLLKKTKISSPDFSMIKPEINANIMTVEQDGYVKLNHFDIVVNIKMIGNKQKIIIPIKHNKHSRHLQTKAKLLKSIQIDENYVYLRWEQDCPDIKKTGNVEGLDQGIKTCITLSDGQTSTKLHGHDLDTITNKIKRQQTGSKAFHKTLKHRNDYIGWCVNQVNFSNIKELRLEKISNYRHKSNVGKKLNYFGEKIIRERD